MAAAPELSIGAPFLGISKKNYSGLMSNSQKKKADQFIQQQQVRGETSQTMYVRELKNISRSFGMVTRVLRQNCDEVQKSEKALQSIRDELLQLPAKGKLLPDLQRIIKIQMNGI